MKNIIKGEDLSLAQLIIAASSVYTGGTRNNTQSDISQESKARKQLETLDAQVVVEKIKGSTVSITASVTAPGFYRKSTFHDENAISAFIENCLQELKNLKS
jgi:hypothetical protein